MHAFVAGALAAGLSLALATGPAGAAPSPLPSTSGSGEEGIQRLVGTAVLVEDSPTGPLVYLRTGDGKHVQVLGVDADRVGPGDLMEVSGYPRASRPGGATIAAMTAVSVRTSPRPAATAGGAPGTFPPSAATAAHLITVVRATWTGGPALSGAPSLASTVSLLDGVVADYWSDQTDGQVLFSVADQVNGIVTTHPACGDGANWSTFIDEVEEKVGFVEADGKHLVVMTPHTSDCGFAGLGTVGYSLSDGGILQSNGFNALDVLGHELGHNISLGHSNLTECTFDGATTTTVGTCTLDEYAGTYSIMGVSYLRNTAGAIGAAQLVRAGLEEPLVLAEAGTVTISPVAGHAGSRAAQYKTSNGDVFTVEYRYPVGVDATAGIGSPQDPSRPVGVLVSRHAPTRGWGNRDTNYVDGDPASNPAGMNGSPVYSRSVLPVGRWVNFNGWGLKVIRQDPSGATVQFDPDRGAAIIPAAAPSKPTFPAFTSYAAGAGTTMARTAPSTQPGVRANLYDETVPVFAADAYRHRVGWYALHAWRAQLCSEAACRYSKWATTRSSARPLTARWLTGSAGGDGVGTLTLTGWSTQQHRAWRVFWCNTRLSGAACEPVSDPLHGTTRAVTGQASVVFDFVRKKVTSGSSSIVADRGSGTNAKGDTYRVVVIVYRSGDGTQTRGTFTSAGRARNVTTWRP